MSPSIHVNNCRCVCTWMCMYACKLLNEAKPGLCCRVSNRSVLSACLVACQNHPDRSAVKRPKHSRAMGIKILAQSPNKTLFCLPHDPIQMISFKKNNKMTKSINESWTSLPNCHKSGWMKLSSMHQLTFFPSTSYILAQWAAWKPTQKP